MSGRPERRAILFLLLATLLWGGAFTAIAATVREMNAYSLLLLRHAGAAVLLFPLFARDLRRLRAVDLPVLALVGFLMVFVYHIGLNLGERTVPPGTASFIVALTPVFVAVLAHFFLKEGSGFLAGFSLALGLLGVFLLQTRPEIGAPRWWDVLLVFLAPFAASVNTILAKRLLGLYSAPLFTGTAMSLGVLLALVGGLWFPLELPRTPVGWFGLAYLTVGSSFLGYVLWFTALRVLPATFVAMGIFLVPLWASLISWLLWGEAFGPQGLLGGLLVLLSLLLGGRAYLRGSA